MKLSLIEKQYERVTSSNDNVYSNLRNKFFLIVSTAIDYNVLLYEPLTYIEATVLTS